MRCVVWCSGGIVIFDSWAKRAQCCLSADCDELCKRVGDAHHGRVAAAAGTRCTVAHDAPGVQYTNDCIVRGSAALSALSALRHARIRVESTVDDTETRAGQRTSCCHSIGSAWHVHIGWRHLGPSTLQRAHSAVHSIVANAAYCQERQFDRLSKTNTVETLLSNLDADALQKCAQIRQVCKQCL